MTSTPSVLILSEYLPTWSLSGSRSRLAAVADFFRRRGYEIHLVVVQPQPAPLKLPDDALGLVQRLSGLSLADHPEFDAPIITNRLLAETRLTTRPRLRRWRRSPDREPSLELPEQIERLLVRERPQIVYIDHSWLAPLVHEVMPRHDCLWVVDTHDCLYLRDQSLAASGLPYESGLLREEESALLEAFDVVIAIQPQERGVFEHMLARARVICVPHAQSVSPQASRRLAVGFVGSACDQNIHGIERFLDGAWPRIAARVPTATLEVAGTVCESHAVCQAASRDARIRRLGVVKETVRIYDSPAVMVCPLWIGSGLKIKLVEALAFGKATVATPVAAQGYEAGAGSAFLLADQANEFADAVVDLLQHRKRRQAFEVAALGFARDHFDPAKVFAELDAVLSERPRRALPQSGAEPQHRVRVLSSRLPARTIETAPPWSAAGAVPAAVPRIIHQIWNSAEVPFDFLGYVDSWRRLHPHWEYRLWTHDDNSRLVARHYPKFLRLFDSYATVIQRADAARYFLLHHFGGVYVDLDARAVRPIDPLLAGRSCVLGLEPQAHARREKRPYILSNAIMASSPGHPFMERVIGQLPRFRCRGNATASTGPFMLSEVHGGFEKPELVHVAPSEQLCPLSMDDADRLFATGHCDADLSAAYVIHYFYGTWWRSSLSSAA